MWEMLQIKQVLLAGDSFEYFFNPEVHLLGSIWNNQTEVEVCRLADLPDLDQMNTFVKRVILE